MINKVLLSTVAIVALAGTAFAADLPSRRAPPVYAPPPIPIFTWTGFYIGGQVGYEFGRDNSFATATADGTGLASGSSRLNGVIGGAHIGYNFSSQSLPVLGSVFGALGSGVVIGIEGDVDGTTSRANYAIGGIGINNRDQIQGSVRGRLGYAFDRFLVYGTGGAAFGGFRNTYSNRAAVAGDSSSSTTRVGYTVGGGVEYAVTNNLSLRAEYRFSDFGSYTDVPNTFNGGIAVRHRDTDNRVQGGFSYKFDTFAPAPVVARY